MNSIGYNPERLPKGYTMDDIDIRIILTNLCVMDFNGPDRKPQIVSLHPGVTVEQVQENTGFELHIPENIAETAAPTEAQMAIIREMDPKGVRLSQIAS